MLITLATHCSRTWQHCLCDEVAIDATSLIDSCASLLLVAKIMSPLHHAERMREIVHLCLHLALNARGSATTTFSLNCLWHVVCSDVTECVSDWTEQNNKRQFRHQDLSAHFRPQCSFLASVLIASHICCVFMFFARVVVAGAQFFVTAHRGWFCVCVCVCVLCVF